MKQPGRTFTVHNTGTLSESGCLTWPSLAAIDQNNMVFSCETYAAQIERMNQTGHQSAVIRRKLKTRKNAVSLPATIRLTC